MPWELALVEYQIRLEEVEGIVAGQKAHQLAFIKASCSIGRTLHMLQDSQHSIRRTRLSGQKIL